VLPLLLPGSQTLRGNLLADNLRRALEVALEFLSLSTSPAEAQQKKKLCGCIVIRCLHVAPCGYVAMWLCSYVAM